MFMLAAIVASSQLGGKDPITAVEHHGIALFFITTPSNNNDKHLTHF